MTSRGRCRVGGPCGSWAASYSLQHRWAQRRRRERKRAAAHRSTSSGHVRSAKTSRARPAGSTSCAFLPAAAPTGAGPRAALRRTTAASRRPGRSPAVTASSAASARGDRRAFDPCRGTCRPGQVKCGTRCCPSGDRCRNGRCCKKCGTRACCDRQRAEKCCGDRCCKKDETCCTSAGRQCAARRSRSARSRSSRETSGSGRVRLRSAVRRSEGTRARGSAARRGRSPCVGGARG